MTINSFRSFCQVPQQAQNLSSRGQIIEPYGHPSLVLLALRLDLALSRLWLLDDQGLYSLAPILEEQCLAAAPSRHDWGAIGCIDDGDGDGDYYDDGDLVERFHL